MKKAEEFGQLRVGALLGAVVDAILRAEEGVAARRNECHLVKPKVALLWSELEGNTLRSVLLQHR